MGGPKAYRSCLGKHRKSERATDLLLSVVLETKKQDKRKRAEVVEDDIPFCPGWSVLTRGMRPPRSVLFIGVFNQLHGLTV